MDINKSQKISYILLFLFVVLAFRLGYLEIWVFPKVKNHPRNTRPILKELSFARGAILDRKGKVLAESFLKENGFYQRRYPYKELFLHPAGYFDPQLGYTGLEKKLNNFLGSQSLKFQKGSKEGMKVILTLDADLQKKAFQLLKGRKGVILAIQPQTGEILTYASSPSISLQEIKKSDRSNLKNQPLVDRVTRGLYPPGSVFKIITLSAALEKGWPLSQSFKAPASLKVGSGKVSNYQRRSYGSLSLEEAFVKSVNTVFAQVGLTLGGENLTEEAEKIGFNKKTSFILPVKESSFPFPRTRLDLAWQAVGQGKVLVTPFQIGVLTAVIANKGIFRPPQLIKEIKTPDGKSFPLSQPKATILLNPEVALKIKEAMIKVVDSGTGKQAKLSKLKVAGKTGTAELDKGKSHSWFACFAPANEPEIVVVTIIEHGGLGGREAATLTRSYLNYFFTENQYLVE